MRWSASGDSDMEEEMAEANSPVLMMGRGEGRGEPSRPIGGGTVTPDKDDASDSSWEAKSARKSSRPKMPPRQHSIGDEPGPLRKRGVRCMECPACLRKDDCAKCEYCRDKKKFGGPGIKKQACM
jgi:hypothetical protein